MRIPLYQCQKQEEKKQSSEACKSVEMVQSAFVMGDQKTSSGKKDLKSRRWPSENFEPVREAKWKVSLDLMSQEKCNFNYEEREQVLSQIRNCRNEEGEILNDLVREDGIAQITP